MFGRLLGETFAPRAEAGHSDGMSMLNVEEVLDQIEATFGERPTTNAIHLAVSRARTGSTSSASWRSSLTSGLPAAQEDDGAGLLFDRDEVREWIRTHPARAGERLGEQLVAHETAAERAEAVGKARADGLSWERIAQVIARVDGRPVSRELVRRVFMPLLDNTAHRDP